MKRLATSIYFLLVIVTLLACSSTVPEEPKADVVGEDGRVFIVDRTGKRWDVTHAVNAYGFVAAEFQYGLGPDAIPPINNPAMLSPGDAGYPANDESFIVIGTVIGGDSRAYRISHLNAHETVNEQFGDVHVTVGW